MWIQAVAIILPRVQQHFSSEYYRGEISRIWLFVTSSVRAGVDIQIFGSIVVAQHWYLPLRAPRPTYLSCGELPLPSLPWVVVQSWGRHKSAICAMKCHSFTNDLPSNFASQHHEDVMKLI